MKPVKDASAIIAVRFFAKIRNKYETTKKAALYKDSLFVFYNSMIILS